MTDRMHTHLTLGLKPRGKCPACDQTRADLARSKDRSLTTV
jgi:hypothetical protein